MLNRTRLPSDVIGFVVFCRLRYRLILRGMQVSHEAIRDWEAKLLPVVRDKLRRRRHGTRCGSGDSWHIDETYLTVRGRWTCIERSTGTAT